MEPWPGVSNQLCHAEPQDAEKVKILLISSFYSIILIPTMCPLSIYPGESLPPSPGESLPPSPEESLPPSPALLGTLQTGTILILILVSLGVLRVGPTGLPWVPFLVTQRGWSGE